MNFINLSTYYRLYAFSDYGSMKAALPYLRSAVLAKKLADIEEAEIRRYVIRVAQGSYKNYLEPINELYPKQSAAQSFISALQVLYKSNGYSARYVVVERR